MALPEGRVTSRFPVCSQPVPSLEARTRRQGAAVPSVPHSFVRPCVRMAPLGATPSRTRTRNRGTVGTGNGVKDLHMERSGNWTWNNRDMAGRKWQPEETPRAEHRDTALMLTGMGREFVGSSNLIYREYNVGLSQLIQIQFPDRTGYQERPRAAPAVR
jgi:hypothetical protein